MDKRITLNLGLGGDDLDFDVTLDDYNRYVNSMTQNDKVAPSHNFCMAVVAKHSEEALKSVINLAGVPVMIAAELVNEYQPDVNIIIKKPKAAASTSKTTA